jgi:hypothetical protein
LTTLQTIKKGKENIAADALSKRDVHFHAITTCVPDWIEEVKFSYVQDTDSSRLLQKLARDVHYSHNFRESAIGRHAGTKATYQRTKRVFCWPNLKSMVTIFECPVCQLVKVEHKHTPGLLQPLHIPGTPWSSISMGFILLLNLFPNPVVKK